MAMQHLLNERIPADGVKPDFSLPAFIVCNERFLPIFRANGYDDNPVAQIFVPVTESSPCRTRSMALPVERRRSFTEWRGSPSPAG